MNRDMDGSDKNENTAKGNYVKTKESDNPIQTKGRSRNWSMAETKRFLEIKYEVDSKYNEDIISNSATMWDYISKKMMDEGYKRSPLVCKNKWNNILNRKSTNLKTEKRIQELSKDAERSCKAQQNNLDEKHINSTGDNAERQCLPQQKVIQEKHINSTEDCKVTKKRKRPYADWENEETQVLLKIKSKMESRINEGNSSYATIWEDISNEMTSHGYERNAWVCRRKWLYVAAKNKKMLSQGKKTEELYKDKEISYKKQPSNMEEKNSKVVYSEDVK